MRYTLVLAATLLACGSGKDSDSTTASGTPGGTAGGTPGGTTGGMLSGTTSGTPAGTTSGTTSGTGTLSSVAISWTDDGYIPTDTDGDGIPDAGCGDSVSVAITGSAPGWSFGMAEGGPSGWTGEDCYNGYGSFAFCHALGPSGGTLIEVPDCSIFSVVAGQSTLFDSGKDPYMTYYIADAASCYVAGFNPSYYASLGCTQMP